MKEKNILSKLLLFICTILALFLTLSGTLAIDSTQDLVWQIVFLPITVFLLISMINSIFFKGRSSLPDLSTPSGKANLVVAFLIFAVFFVIGVRGVVGGTRQYPKGVQINTSDTLNNAEITASPVPTETGQEIQDSVYITISTKEENTIVNIRKEPNLESEVVDQATDGDVFTLIDRGNGWYLVNITDYEKGWIQEKFVR